MQILSFKYNISVIPGFELSAINELNIQKLDEQSSLKQEEMQPEKILPDIPEEASGTEKLIGIVSQEKVEPENIEENQIDTHRGVKTNNKLLRITYQNKNIVEYHRKTLYVILH